MTRDVTIEVTSRHESVSERMKSYATEKAEKLFRFHTRISRVQIVLDGVHDQPLVEIIVHVDSGRTFVAREQGEHFKGTMDQLVEKMERQLKKDNERRKHHKGHGSAGDVPPEPAGGSNDPEDPEETYDDAVRRDLSK